MDVDDASVLNYPLHLEYVLIILECLILECISNHPHPTLSLLSSPSFSLYWMMEALISEKFISLMLSTLDNLLIPNPVLLRSVFEILKLVKLVYPPKLISLLIVLSGRMILKYLSSHFCYKMFSTAMHSFDW